MRHISPSEVKLSIVSLEALQEDTATFICNFICTLQPSAIQDLIVGDIEEDAVTCEEYILDLEVG